MLRMSEMLRPRRLARAAAIVALGTAPLAASGCELVLGMDKHSSRAADAPDATGGDDAADASAVCVLPTAGDATLRFGHFAPTTARLDVCLRRTDGTSPVDGTPIVAGGGAGCPRGAGYKELTAPFAVPSGTYDVRVVAGADCAGAPFAEVKGVAVDAQSPVILFAVGATSGPTVLPLHAGRAKRNGYKLRFVNAVAGGAALDFGLVDAPALPAKLDGALFSSVPPGATATLGTGDAGGATVDADGYTDLGPASKLALGAAPAGTSDAILAFDPLFIANDAFTVLALGSASDVRFPKELVVCDEAIVGGAVTRCGAPPIELTIDAFNPSLWGPAAPLWRVRHDAVIAAIAQLDSDVACIPEVWSDDDKRALVLAAKAHFPYAVTFSDTNATPVDDATDQNGMLPAPRTTAPCAASAARLDGFLDCVRDHCSTKPGDETSVFIDDPATCVAQNCQASATPLLFGPDASKQCWSCALPTLEGGATVGFTRSACKTDPLARFAFSGASAIVLLSKHPIAASEQWVIPSTEWREIVARAELALPGGATLDAYCTELTSPQVGITHPYTGGYGGAGADSDAQWVEEQTLQAKKVLAYVLRRSGSLGRRAVVSGELFASPGAPGVDAINPAAFAVLSGALPLATPPDYAPACTFCANNPINTPPGQAPSGRSTWTTLTFLVNVPVTDVVTSSLLLREATIPYSGYAVPASPYYGFRTKIRVSP